MKKSEIDATRNYDFYDLKVMLWSWKEREAMQLASSEDQKKLLLDVFDNLSDHDRPYLSTLLSHMAPYIKEDVWKDVNISYAVLSAVWTTTSNLTDFKARYAFCVHLINSKSVGLLALQKLLNNNSSFEEKLGNYWIANLILDTLTDEPS